MRIGLPRRMRYQQLELTLRNLLDVETGGRGFALSGDQLFLEPYEVGNMRSAKTWMCCAL
jgi:CHASE3 domain sensor protein